MKNNYQPNVLLDAGASGEGGGGGAGGGQGGAAGGQGGAGAGVPDWRASIPEDIRNDPTLKDIKDVGSLAKSLVHAQRMIGTEKVAKPQKNWTPQQHADFYNQIGRPENPDGYSFKPEKLPDGVTLDEAKFADTKKTLHSLGLTDTQASGVLKYYLDHVGSTATSAQQAAEAERVAAIAQLKEEFGNDFDTKVGVAQAVVKKFGSEELQSVIDEIGNKPGFIKLFSAIGEAMLDDTARGSGSGLIVTDAAQALAEINQLKMDTEFQTHLNNKQSPGNKAALERWTMLHEKAYQPKK
jgi:hypothetical protein